jgi:hypothetical protein
VFSNEFIVRVTCCCCSFDFVYNSTWANATPPPAPGRAVKPAKKEKVKHGAERGTTIPLAILIMQRASL